MNRIIKNLIQIILIFCCNSIIAQQVTVSVKIDTNTILIGDQIKLKYSINSPSNYHFQFPVFTDKLTDKIEIVAQSNIDTTFNQNKTELILSKTLTVTSFDSGIYVIPTFPIQFEKNNDTTVFQILTDSIFLKVNAIPVDTTLAIKDIKAPLDAPLTLKEILLFILIGIGLIAIIFIIVYLIKRYNKKKNNVLEPLKPKIPPFKKALQDFEILRQKKLWQNDKIKEYHSELTEILRVYFEQHLGIQALEKTTDETLEAFENVNDDKNLYYKLKQILTLADLVKFAKQLPLPDQHDLNLQYAIEIVKETSVHIKKDNNLDIPENSNNN